MSKHVKVAVTGAAGQIGYALLFRIANGDMFGQDTRVDLHLLELAAALPALKGVAMELEDCAFPLLNKIVCTADLAVAFKDVNYAVLVGSVPRKAGMERSELLNINGKIFIGQGKAINDNAANDVKVFVVGNPCNTNCLIAMHNAPDVPKQNFFAMTTLDEKRGESQLAIKAGQPVTAVKKMCIWGNHSSTQYPDFYHAEINGKPALDVIGDEQWLQTQFLTTVQKRGAAVIEARGASSAASAANAAIHFVHNTLVNTAADDYYSLGQWPQGTYGIDDDIIFSLPTRTEKGVLKVVTGIQHNAFGQAKVAAGLAELREERDAVKALGLI